MSRRIVNVKSLVVVTCFFYLQTLARRVQRQNRGRQRQRIGRILHSTCTRVHRITQSGIV